MAGKACGYRCFFLDSPGEADKQMHKIVRIKVLDGYRIWIRFADKVQGTVDLSDLAGKTLRSLARYSLIRKPTRLAWPGGIDLAPDALYGDVVAQKAA